MDPIALAEYIAASAAVGTFALDASRRISRTHDEETQRPQDSVADDNVVIGEPPPNLGHGNVIIRPTGDRSITIGGGVAIGHGAQADETSVAIGHGAGAGRRTAMAVVPSSVVAERMDWLTTIMTGALAAIIAGLVFQLLHL